MQGAGETLDHVFEPEPVTPSNAPARAGAPAMATPFARRRLSRMGRPVGKFADRRDPDDDPPPAPAVIAVSRTRSFVDARASYVA